MKATKTIAICLLGAAALMLVTSAASAGPPRQHADNWYRAQAKRALKPCIHRAAERGWEITSSVSTISACFAGGFITEVSFAKQLVCLPNQPCPKAPTYLVGTVRFGCDNEIIDAHCAYSACAVDADCMAGEWCRPTSAGASECVPFVGEGDSCGGFVLPWYRERCEPDLSCVPSEPTGDIPGTCATCNYNGTPYYLGDSFPADDGCNTCFCGEGGLIGCTKIYCVPK